MLENLIIWSLRNRILVLLLCGMLGVLGLWALKNTSVDALPDLSDPQVIVKVEAEGQSPRLIEDQITSPLSGALLSVAHAKTVRSYSFFGYALINVILEERADLSQARSRILEILNSDKVKIPDGIKASLGPDASALGWVYEYALTSDSLGLGDLRSLQDWNLHYGLSAVPGVSEVAAVGGFSKEVQIRLDPQKVKQYSLSLDEITRAIKWANQDVGGELIEQGETEFMIRGRGYLRDLQEVREIPIRFASSAGEPLRLQNIASVDWGPSSRRGLVELNGEGEVVGGVVIMRQGENALEVIQNTKSKLRQLQTSLPKNVKIIPTYDRTEIISKAIANLNQRLFEEMLVVALVCGLFLMHIRSAMVAVISLPLALLLSFLAMKIQGLNANIMSLGGLAIAIGAMVDAAIILVENAHKKLEHNRGLPSNDRLEHWNLIQQSCIEVGPALFWSLALITISFVPIFALEAQEGRLFIPLALTKSYAMAAATFLSVTLVPVLLGYLLQGKIPNENRNPINRWMVLLYGAIMTKLLKWPKITIGIGILVLLSSIWPLSQLGSQFMPPLDEGDLLYMPSTEPGISITKAREILRRTDTLIRTVPEVDRVFGKAGRAQTATDPAGLEMLETIIHLKDKAYWRSGMTIEKIIWALDSIVQIPGLNNAWTMPIKARVDMLSTGIKTPLGIKISGPNLDTLALLGATIAKIIQSVPGTSSAYAEKSVSGNYLDIQVNRQAAARYGLSVAEVQNLVQTGLGGQNVGTWVQGLERYPISLRYAREYRDQVESIADLPLSTPTGGQIPLGELTSIQFSQGPMVIRTEGGVPNSWVLIDTRTQDLGAYIENAQEALAHSGFTLPVGYHLVWSGEYESMQRAKNRLQWLIPMTLFLILILLYINTKSLGKSFLVLATVPFSLVGAFWLLWILGYQLSVAVAVGLIALAGLDAETGVVMLLYLDHSIRDAQSKGSLDRVILSQAIYQGAVMRLRPKLMTATVILLALVPIMWSDATGSDLMKRIATPMLGGVSTSVLMELLLYPCIYLIWKRRCLTLEM